MKKYIIIISTKNINFTTKWMIIHIQFVKPIIADDCIDKRKSIMKLAPLLVNH